MLDHNHYHLSTINSVCNNEVCSLLFSSTYILVVYNFVFTLFIVYVLERTQCQLLYCSFITDFDHVSAQILQFVDGSYLFLREK